MIGAENIVFIIKLKRASRKHEQQWPRTELPHSLLRFGSMAWHERPMELPDPPSPFGEVSTSSSCPQVTKIAEESQYKIVQSNREDKHENSEVRDMQQKNKCFREAINKIIPCNFIYQMKIKS